jgi:hypothetical protein
MRVKNWQNSIFKTIVQSLRIRLNRATRRRQNKRRTCWASAALLSIAVTTPLLESTAAGQCDGPLFPGPTFAAGDRPLSVTTGDFNGDGLSDLAAASSYSDDVSVLLGNGDGTFAAQQKFAATNGPRCVTAGEFNGDSLTDLATANYPADVSVLLGNGDGTFAAQLNFA